MVKHVIPKTSNNFGISDRRQLKESELPVYGISVRLYKAHLKYPDIVEIYIEITPLRVGEDISLVVINIYDFKQFPLLFATLEKRKAPTEHNWRVHWNSIWKALSRSGYKYRIRRGKQGESTRQYVIEYEKFMTFTITPAGRRRLKATRDKNRRVSYKSTDGESYVTNIRPHLTESSTTPREKMVLRKRRRKEEKAEENEYWGDEDRESSEENHNPTQDIRALFARKETRNLKKKKQKKKKKVKIPKKGVVTRPARLKVVDDAPSFIKMQRELTGMELKLRELTSCSRRIFDKGDVVITVMVKKKTSTNPYDVASRVTVKCVAEDESISEDGSTDSEVEVKPICGDFAMNEVFDTGGVLNYFICDNDKLLPAWQEADSYDLNKIQNIF